MAAKPADSHRPAPVRTRAWRFGRSAEWLCAMILRLKGYRILATRLRNPAGEIDLIAKHRNVVVFVEVKARADLTVAIEALGPRQRARIERAAEAWMAQNPRYQGADMRFDAMLVGRNLLPRHIVDAWRPE